RRQNLPQNRRKITLKRAVIRIFALSDASTAGVLQYNDLHFPAALGKGGIRPLKREGDGATPRGYWPAIRAYYRPDRMRRPAAALPIEPLRESYGWCDAPGD